MDVNKINLDTFESGNDGFDDRGIDHIESDFRAKSLDLSFKRKSIFSALSMAVIAELPGLIPGFFCHV
jgi:hypothetical protein